MLRSVCFKNFVKFKDYQVLDFPSKRGGPFIFIGENGSGKTSVFEGMRRCLKLEYSSSISSVFDKEALSFFISYFEEKKDKSDDLEKTVSGIILIPSKKEGQEEELAKHDQDIEQQSIYTETLYQRMKGENGKEPHESKTRYYKFVMKSSDCNSMFINLIDKSEDGTGLKVSRKYIVRNDFCQKERNYFIEAIENQKQKSVDIEIYLKSILDNIDEMPEDFDNRLESILYTLTNDLVFVFPLRSVGPLQWSESNRLVSKFRQQNYKEAEKKCEIIKYFLTDSGEKFDKDKEKKYFEQLTQFVDYNFALGADGEITLPKGKYALLKTPEGILEAKAFSILISSRQYKTLFLEEPDRGMHPQLVERMIQIINQEKSSKRVILTTHQKGFITPWTMPDTFIFRRGTENRIISGNGIFNGDKNANMKKMRMVTSHHVPDIFFARKVLFYEGDSEDLFLRELKSQIVTCKHSDTLKELYGENEEVAKCLVEYTFIKINGEGNRDLYRKVSDKLQLEYLFLLDRDSVDLQKELNIPNEEIEQQLESERDREKIRIKILDFRTKHVKEKREFFWLDGNIEKMVTTTCDNCSDLAKDLLKCKVISKTGVSNYKITGKAKRGKNKLYLNEDINSDNISESTSAMIKFCKREDDLFEIIKILTVDLKTNG